MKALRILLRIVSAASAVMFICTLLYVGQIEDAVLTTQRRVGWVSPAASETVLSLKGIDFYVDDETAIRHRLTERLMWAGIAICFAAELLRQLGTRTPS